MDEREKVIKGLTVCLDSSLTNCERCPYKDDPDCTTTIMQQALIFLLKERKDGIIGTESEILA